MIEKSYSSRICVLVLLVLCLLLVPSCKKSPTENPSGKAEQQKAVDVQSDEVKAEVKAEVKPEVKPEVKAEVKAEVKTETAAPVVSASELVPLPIELPKPMFIGTPQNINVPNLEKPSGKLRPPFLAPAGTVNVALGKPVAGSDDEPIIGDIEMITDGDKEAADGSYVELAPFLQNVTVDLGAKHDIYAILVWHFHKQPMVYFDVVVQVADDPDFLTNVKTLFNNDIDNSAGLGIGSDMHYIETAEGRLIDAKGVQARYVRLYSNGNSGNELNHYIEVEVFGKPTK